MKILPITINENTCITYQPSPESLALIGEEARNIFAENFEWDKDHCPSLVSLCIQVIKDNFTKNPILNELPCESRNYLLEIILDVPLELVVNLIDDEIYWKRRYHEKFGICIMSSKRSEFIHWKTLYIERHVQKMLEQAQPEHSDEYEMEDMTKLCAPYVRQLIVTQLQAWKPPLHWDEEDIPEFPPTDHITFGPIFKNLVNIEEFSVSFGMNDVGDKFKWHMFELSVSDCQGLGTAIRYLPRLRILRIHRSKIEDDHIRAFTRGFIKNETVEELDLSHCLIGDKGALCIAKVLMVHPKLRNLNLCNNKIGGVGGEGLGFALLNPDCNLEELNLRLNPLGERGAMGVMRALVRGTKLVELSMAACQFDGEAHLRTGQMLILNTSLKNLDISNNWFDEEGGAALVDGLTVNRTLHYLDVRETDITVKQEVRIKQLLHRNQLGLDDIVPEEEEQICENEITETQQSRITIEKNNNQEEQSKKTTNGKNNNQEEQSKKTTNEKNNNQEQQSKKATEENNEPN